MCDVLKSNESEDLAIRFFEYLSDSHFDIGPNLKRE